MSMGGDGKEGERKKTSLMINHTTTNAVCCPDKKKAL